MAPSIKYPQVFKITSAFYLGFAREMVRRFFNFKYPCGQHNTTSQATYRIMLPASTRQAGLLYRIHKYETCGSVNSVSANPRTTIEIHFQHPFSEKYFVSCHLELLDWTIIIEDHMTVAYYMNSYRTHCHFCRKTFLYSED
jgi:hypothetical protein